MSRFNGLSGAQVSKTGIYMKPGRYQVKILATKWIKGQMGKEFVVVEFKILQSNNPEVPVSSERSWVVDMSPSNIMALPNVKGFLAAVSGVDGTLDDATSRIVEFWKDKSGVEMGVEDIMEELIIGQNILADVDMDLECVEIETRAGNPFTKFNWGLNVEAA